VKIDPDDIVIAGGGVAGFAAAIGASSSGRRVVMLEKSPITGGNATLANVGTICGAFYQLPDRFVAVGYPFTKTFVLELAKRCGTSPLRHSELTIVPYEWSILQTMIHELLTEHKVEVSRETTIAGATRRGNRLCMTIEKHGSTEAFIPHAIVDCTGNAVISSLLGFETLGDKTYQAASQVFRVRRVAEANEFALALSIKRAALQLDAGQSDDPRMAFDIIPGSLRNNAVDIKLTLSAVITDRTDFMEIQRQAVDRITRVFPILASNVLYLQDASIEHIFPQLGVRVLRRSKGKFILGEQDIIQNRRFDDCVAIGTWPLEEWDYSGRVHLRFAATNDGYDIPARCLQSEESPDLLFAGKNISATSSAISSARVIGTSLQTGYAAGKMAGAEEGNEREDTVRHLNNLLREAVL
jgi:hypothetical protein